MTLTDADMDDIHHALGRPDGPHIEPYRNYYCCAVDGPEARRFALSDAWRQVGTINEGRDAVFHVTPVGRAHLWRWLAEKQAGKGVRAFLVSAEGCSTRSVVAKSASAARYDLYLHLADAGWCRTFTEFLRLKPRAVPA